MSPSENKAFCFVSLYTNTDTSDFSSHTHHCRCILALRSRSCRLNKRCRPTRTPGRTLLDEHAFMRSAIRTDTDDNETRQTPISMEYQIDYLINVMKRVGETSGYGIPHVLNNKFGPKEQVRALSCSSDRSIALFDAKVDTGLPPTGYCTFRCCAEAMSWDGCNICRSTIEYVLCQRTT